MSLIRPALPFPLNVLRETQTLDGEPARNNLQQKLNAERQALQQQIESLESRLVALSSYNTNDHIEGSYDPPPDPDEQLRKNIWAVIPCVGLLRWNNNLDDMFSGIGESPGNVSGQPWAMGVMLNKDIFLTSIHSFCGTGGGWQWPTRRGQPLMAEELVKHFHVKLFSKDTFKPAVHGQFNSNTSMQSSDTDNKQDTEEIAVTAVIPDKVKSTGFITVQTQSAQHLEENGIPNRKQQQNDLSRIGSEIGYIVFQNTVITGEESIFEWKLVPAVLNRVEQVKNYSSSRNLPVSERISITPIFKEVENIGATIDDSSQNGPSSRTSIALGSPVLNQTGEIIALYLGPSIDHSHHEGIIVDTR